MIWKMVILRMRSQVRKLLHLSYMENLCFANAMFKLLSVDCTNHNFRKHNTEH